MNELLGKRINEILVNDDQSILIFDTDQGDVIYEAWGDCCSETWFADITGVHALIGGVVAQVEDVPMESVDDARTRQEFDEFYGVKLITDKGYADIVYRNSSNGYYGGSIECIKRYRPEDGLSKITDDWQASA